MNMLTKSQFRWLITYGKLRIIGKPLYTLAVSAELASQRMIDCINGAPKAPGKPYVERNLTAVVKTFERPAVLRRLIAGIWRNYPHLRIIVADDSRRPSHIGNVQTVIMPCDSGISAGRNEALRHVETQYVLLLDDDFVIYRHTNLAASLAIMENYSQIDIMGGEVIDLPFFTKTDYSKASLYPSNSKSTMPAGSYIGGLPVYDKVANFFIGRTDRIKLVQWDPQLKKLEHADFFTRAKGVLTTVFNANMKCLHAPTPFDAAYMKRRHDLAADREVIKLRYYCSR